jgi:hypothetical protein
MPGAQEFLEGFGFNQGTMFGGYLLSQARATHTSVRQYQEYKYNITLVFSHTGYSTYSVLSNALHTAITQQHIIYGVRNPYRCIIEMPVQGDILQDDNGDITVHLTGHSYRAN